MSYIDGYVVPVKTSRKQDYVTMATQMAKRFLEWGATRVVECWGDDVPTGKTTDYKRAVAAESDETVVFSWIEWPSKDARDAGMKKMHDDPELAALMKKTDMPFNPQRMIVAGFAAVVDQSRSK